MKDGKSISANEIVQFRKFLGLSQQEFGRLLGVTTITASNWEKNGLMEDRAGYNQLLTILGLFKNAKQHPEFISVPVLRKMIYLCAKGFLFAYFAHIKEIANFDLSLIKARDFAGFMFALALDMYVRSLGKTSPSQVIAMELNVEQVTEEPDLSPNEVLADILIGNDL
jgi:transcriptional regulator with XRE-family HTH domain